MSFFGHHAQVVSIHKDRRLLSRCACPNYSLKEIRAAERAEAGDSGAQLDFKLSVDPIHPARAPLMINEPSTSV